MNALADQGIKFFSSSSTRSVFACKGFNCATRPEARRDKTKEFIIHF